MTLLAPQPPARPSAPPSAPIDHVTDDISHHPQDCATGDLVEYVRTNAYGTPHPDNTDLAAVLGELMRRHRCSTSDQLIPLIMGHVGGDDD